MGRQGVAVLRVPTAEANLRLRLYVSELKPYPPRYSLVARIDEIPRRDSYRAVAALGDQHLGCRTGEPFMSETMQQRKTRVTGFLDSPPRRLGRSPLKRRLHDPSLSKNVIEVPERHHIH